jgi:hypothetical protein
MAPFDFLVVAELAVVFSDDEKEFSKLLPSRN